MNDTQQELADRIRDEAPGEILRMKLDMDGFLVVQKLPDDPAPELYRVTIETQRDGVESLHWAFLGSIDPDESRESVS